MGAGPLGKRTENATPISVALRGEPRDDTPGFLRVPYTELVPPDPALERDDLSPHHRALHAFAYYLARNSENKELLQKLTQEPSAWSRTKESIGRVMLSAGTSLISDIREIGSRRVEGITAVVDSLIRNAAGPR